MMRRTTVSPASKIVALLACLSCAALLSTGIAAGAEGTVTYQHESLQEYEQQLAGGKIQAASINKVLRSVRITLKDGSHVLAKYGKGEEPKVKQALQAKGVPVTILSHAEAAKEAKKSPKHKLRYIAGAVVIVVLIVVGGVLFLDRKRKAQRD
ncbi:MAG: hypothetical protein H0X28_06665 [Solirubrobacterales bacterium]|nr:hypothetical protein [Solirubrobacterales bacterium]